MRRLFAASIAAAAVCAAMLSVTPAAAAVPTTVAHPRPQAQDDAVGLSPNAQPKAITGQQNWVILRCQYETTWPSANSTENDKSYFDTMFGNTTPFLGDYWKAASYGKISLSTTVEGNANEWRTVGHANSYFGADQDDQDSNKLTEACADAWDADVTFSSSTYYGFVYDQPSQADFGGRFFFSPHHDGQASVLGALMGGHSQQDESTWAHEMGHAFGLQHSFGGDGQPYNTAYDIMSAPSGECPGYGGGSWWSGNGGEPRTEHTLDYGCIPGQLLAYHKAKVLGWIPASRQFTATGGTHTITLERLADPTTKTSYLMAEIPAGGNAYYTVEARLKTGIEIDSTPYPDTKFTTGYDENIPSKKEYVAGQAQKGCIVVNKVTSDPVTGDTITLQGKDTDHNGWWDDQTDSGTNGGSCFQVGSTFQAGAVKVVVKSKTAHSFNVTITAPKLQGSDYYPLSHKRILSSSLGAGKTASLKVLGAGGIPAHGVSAVVLNVWGVSPSATSALTVYPSNLSKPATQNLQLVKHRTSSNLVTVAPGSDGKIKITNAAGSVHVMADVVGYYGSPYGGLRYTPVSGQPAYPPLTACVYFCTLPANSTTEIGIQGYGALPPSGVSAVALQVTSNFPNGNGKLFVYPKGSPKPALNDIAYRKGDTHTWLVIVKTGANGNIMVHNAGSSDAYLNLRVEGWYGAGAADTFRPIKPARVVPGSTNIASNATKSIKLGGVGGVSASAKAVLLNISVLHPTNTGYLNVSATGGGTDTSSYDVGFYKGSDANAAISGIGTANKVDFTDQYTATHFAVDVLGWFGAP
jgi:M6 family metalloprotease-like protein